jgi:biotin carboxyl carrier protein
MSSYFVTINNKEYTVTFEHDGGITVNGRSAPLDIRQLDAQTFSLLRDGASRRVIVERFQDGYRLLVNGKQASAQVESERARLLKRFDHQSTSKHHKAEVTAPMPALVVKVMVEVGQEVKQGQGLLILEAMKMENEIKAHKAGIVKEISVTKGRAVEKGELLLLVE